MYNTLYGLSMARMEEKQRREAEVGQSVPFGLRQP